MSQTAERPQSRSAEKARYESNKLAKRLRSAVGAAIGDYRMIEDGDRVMVCRAAIWRCWWRPPCAPPS